LPSTRSIPRRNLIRKKTRHRRFQRWLRSGIFGSGSLSPQATDYAPATGTLIFDIGGNKYRLIARVDFEEQMLFIQTVMTHEKYNRENL
jgi:hypothetical protein